MPSHVSAVRYLCTAASSLSRHLRTLRHIKVESTVKRSHSTRDLLQERSAGESPRPEVETGGGGGAHTTAKSAERLNGRALKTTYTAAHKSAFRIPKEISRSTVSFLLCVCVCSQSSDSKDALRGYDVLSRNRDARKFFAILFFREVCLLCAAPP